MPEREPADDPPAELEPPEVVHAIPAAQPSSEATDERDNPEEAAGPVANETNEAVPPSSATAILRLDSSQAIFFAAAIVLCLLSQGVIVVVLLRQRNRHAPAAVHGSDPSRIRRTSVVDLEAENGLLSGAGGTLRETWESEDEAMQRQEAAIVEELVSMNVAMESALAQS